MRDLAGFILGAAFVTMCATCPKAEANTDSEIREVVRELKGIKDEIRLLRQGQKR